jgi:hypothetical protein
MTQDYRPAAYTDPAYAPPTLIDTTAAPSEDPSGPGVADVAKDQATQLGQSATDATQHVAEVAKEQVAAVASETGRQAKDLMQQAQTELAEQASAQQQRVAAGLRSLGDELHSMSRHNGDKGVATDLASQAASKTHDVAGWLDEREPGQLVSELRDFARRHPGAFLGAALGAGLVAARLGRGAVAAASDDDASPPDATSAPLPSGASAPSYQEPQTGSLGSSMDEGTPPPTPYSGVTPPASIDELGLASPLHHPNAGLR